MIHWRRQRKLVKNPSRVRTKGRPLIQATLTSKVFIALLEGLPLAWARSKTRELAFVLDVTRDCRPMIASLSLRWCPRLGLVQWDCFWASHALDDSRSIIPGGHLAYPSALISSDGPSFSKKSGSLDVRSGQRQGTWGAMNDMQPSPQDCYWHFIAHWIPVSLSVRRQLLKEIKSFRVTGDGGIFSSRPLDPEYSFARKKTKVSASGQGWGQECCPGCRLLRKTSAGAPRISSVTPDWPRVHGCGAEMSG